MSKFIGTFVNKIDAKGRVSIPAEFRAALADQAYNGLICIPSITEAAVDAGGLDRLEEIHAMIEEIDPYAEERAAFEISLMGGARRFNFDADGRILLTAELIDHAQLNGQAAFVGRGEKFQIWNPDLFEVERARALELARERRGLLVARRKRGRADSDAA
ncbi:MAG: division/cell wall cluster transcriptional repressor MraZ [Parvularculaceae bacterium]